MNPLVNCVTENRDQIWSMNTEQQSELKFFPASYQARKMHEKNHFAANLNYEEIPAALLRRKSKLLRSAWFLKTTRNCVEIEI